MDWNLHTGFMSPQYHNLFDDNFWMVFNNGTTSEELDKICHELFVENHDSYMEDTMMMMACSFTHTPALDKV
ncbi:hypothetical protein ACHAW6_014705 [Cyclotella cf. meneghiniana]